MEFKPQIQVCKTSQHKRQCKVPEESAKFVFNQGFVFQNKYPIVLDSATMYDHKPVKYPNQMELEK